VVEAFSSDTTVTIINPVVSYSAGTISVTVDVVPRAGTAEALPTGALVGIVLGTIVIGVILVIAVLLVRRAQHAKNTEYMKQKYDEMNGKTTYTQAP
jgi:large-conductance mechanosensitive channel